MTSVSGIAKSAAISTIALRTAQPAVPAYPSTPAEPWRQADFQILSGFIWYFRNFALLLSRSTEIRVFGKSARRDG